MTGAYVDKVNVHAVDVGRELRQRVEPRFDLPPVVAAAPVLNQLLHLRELRALRAVVYRFLVRPARRIDAPAKIIERGLRYLDLEGANRGVAGRGGLRTGRGGERKQADRKRSCRSGEKAAPSG